MQCCCFICDSTSLQFDNCDVQLSLDHILLTYACCVAESVQYWLQGKAATQTLMPTNSMQTFAPASASKSARLGGTPLQRTDSCRWGSFRQRRHTARRSASLGIVDSSNRDIMMSQPLPEGGSSNPHGVLDSADSLFDTLTFHFHGL